MTLSKAKTFKVQATRTQSFAIIFTEVSSLVINQPKSQKLTEKIPISNTSVWYGRDWT
jgi:hypothetical protein